MYGGSGHGFDHALLAEVRRLPEARPLVLSGGLNPTNVQAAIASTQPWAVDVSSGVESSPGMKSNEKILDFVAAVFKANSKAAL
jgi:phosphoribosylanthranilate isomerase